MADLKAQGFSLENAMYRVLQLYGGTVVQARPPKIHNPLPPHGRTQRNGGRNGRRDDDDQQGGRHKANGSSYDRAKTYANFDAGKPSFRLTPNKERICDSYNRSEDKTCGFVGGRSQCTHHHVCDAKVSDGQGAWKACGDPNHTRLNGHPW